MTSRRVHQPRLDVPGLEARTVVYLPPRETGCGEWIVRVWVLREGRFLGDVDLVVRDVDNVARILADNLLVSVLAYHAKHHPQGLFRLPEAMEGPR